MRSSVKRLVECALETGGTVVVGVDEPSGDPSLRGMARDHFALAAEPHKTFEDATAAVAPAARSLVTQPRAIEDPPHEVRIEFGARLSGQTGAFIASAAGEANITVSMTWQRRNTTGG